MFVKDAEASYDVNDQDADPSARYDATNSNELALFLRVCASSAIMSFHSIHNVVDRGVLQAKLDMARVLKESHSFTCTLTSSSAIGMSHTCLCLSSYSWYSFTDPGRMEGWVGMSGWLHSETIYLPTRRQPPIPLLNRLNVEQLRWSRPTRYRYTKLPQRCAIYFHFHFHYREAQTAHIY